MILFLICLVTMILGPFALLAWYALWKKDEIPGCAGCGGHKFHYWQDGGHDYCRTCLDCGRALGIQAEPFDIIERLPDWHGVTK